MKKPSSVCVLVVFLSFLLTIPTDILAGPEPQTAGQRAGEVSRLIPAVNISRNSKTINASAKTVVDWEDLVNTQINARARIALDDGSVLNVGSESSLRVVKHDAGAQQTELELTYGKLRTQAQKIAKPDGKFEVHTPAGVAGVVGTDFYVSYENNSGTMNVIVFDGLVKVCNLAGVCVMVKAGQMTNLRSGNNSGPLTPMQATLDLLTASVQATEPGGSNGAGLGNGLVASSSHIGTAGGIAIGVIAALPVIIVPIIVTRGGNRVAADRGACIPTNLKTCG